MISRSSAIPKKRLQVSKEDGLGVTLREDIMNVGLSDEICDQRKAVMKSPDEDEIAIFVLEKRKNLKTAICSFGNERLRGNVYQWFHAVGIQAGERKGVPPTKSLATKVLL